MPYPLATPRSAAPARALRGALLAAGLLSLWAAPARAAGRDIACGGVEAGTIHVDGLISDWEGVSSTEIAGSPVPADGKPLVAKLRCNYDDKALYLLIEVQDDSLVRTAAAGPLEDHLEVALDLGGGRMDRLLVYPGSYQQKLPRRLRWAAGGAGLPRPIDGEGPAGRAKPLKGPPVVEVYDSLLPLGYSVELRLPLKALPAHKPGTPLPLGIKIVDVDSRARPQIVSVADTSSGERPEDLSRVQFQEAQSALESLLDDLKAGHSDIWWDKTGDIGGGPGRVLMIARALCVIGKEYGWQEVAPSRQDIKDVQLVSVGDKLTAAALRTSESGGGGSRELLRLYRLQKGQFQPIFIAEVRKQIGQDVLESQVSYVKRGKAVDIVLTAKPPVGFTEATYQEFPATDAQPILLPWKDKKARYVMGPDGRYSKAP